MAMAEAPNWSLLSTLDFQAIDEMDPSLADGHRIIYDREVPFELRTQENADRPHELGTMEGVKVKILTLGDDRQQVSLRVELTTESDLFFHYTCSVNGAGFRQLKEEQRLVCEFPEFSSFLVKLLNRCIKEPQNFLAALIVTSDGNAVLEFVQNMEYKFVEILVLPFRESPEHLIRQSISFRYNAVRSRLSMMQARLQDVSALVKAKTPSLVTHLQRNPTAPQQADPSSSSSSSGLR